MDTSRVFSVRELVVIGVLSGVAVSLVKAIQAGFFLGGSSVEFYAALLTYASYMVLGAFGAVFLVDHEVKGQKMLKSAFLMGIVAPSVFLATLNNQAISVKSDRLARVPNISMFFVSEAYAQSEIKGLKDPAAKPIVPFEVIQKSKVEPSFFEAFQKALGRNVPSDNYAYIVGATKDERKARETAALINAYIKARDGGQPMASYGAKVLQPAGKKDFYVAVGELGTQQQAGFVRDWATDTAIGYLRAARPESEEGRKIATYVLKGQVVDVREMFEKPVSQAP